MLRRYGSGRNTGLDILKFICAFLVVCLHTSFGAEIWLVPPARMAVPVFFMISGYFYPEDRMARRRQLRKILFLLLCWSCVYAAWNILTALGMGIDPGALVGSWLKEIRLWDVLLFNSVPFGGHLWYLAALLYVLLLMLPVGEIQRRKLYVFILPLLCAALALGTYAPLVLGRSLPAMYSRNFLFTGLPFFLTGSLLRDKEELSDKYMRPITVMFIASLLCTFAESRLMNGLSHYIDADLYISTLFLAPSAFVLAKNKGRNAKGLLLAAAALGRHCSLGIYLMHPMVLQLLPGLLSPVFLQFPALAEIYRQTVPLPVFFVTAIPAALPWLLKKRKKEKALEL